MEKKATKGRYTFYGMGNEHEHWYLYDRKYSRLADGWGIGGKVMGTKAAIMKIADKLNQLPENQI